MRGERERVEERERERERERARERERGGELGQHCATQNDVKILESICVFALLTKSSLSIGRY